MHTPQHKGEIRRKQTHVAPATDVDTDAAALRLGEAAADAELAGELVVLDEGGSVPDVEVEGVKDGESVIDEDVEREDPNDGLVDGLAAAGEHEQTRSSTKLAQTH